MTIPETVSVFVGIPSGIVALITLAVYGKAILRQPNRYRPGRPWTYQPSWFVPHPDAVLPAGRIKRPPGSAASSTTAVGGASGEW